MIEDQFGNDLLSIAEKNIPSDFSATENLHTKGFIEEAICTAIARNRPVLSRMSRSSVYLIVDSHATDVGALEPLSRVVGKMTGNVPGLFSTITGEYPRADQVCWAEAVRTSVDMRNGAVWFVIDPDIWIWPPRSRRDAAGFLKSRRRNRYNRKYDELLSAWVKVIFATDASPVELDLTLTDGPESAGNPVFRVRSRSTGARKLGL